jgi:ABC-type sugar transport system ATPase subunit
MADTKPLLEFRKISKSFPGVKALNDVDMSFRKGEVHALVGENGAGKSTLMKILCGVYQPSAGQIVYNGENVAIRNPHEAQLMGISIIFQEFSLIGHLDVVSNVFLNREPSGFGGFKNQALARKKTLEIFERMGVEMDIDRKVSELSVVEQQLVEIAKALSVTAQVLIMDEPSAPLTDKELTKLFEIIRSLKEQGVTVIYISHMLEEIFEIADRVTVLKDGEVTHTDDVSNMTKDLLVKKMVGRDIDDIYPEPGNPTKDILLEVRNMSCGGRIEDISFTLRKGEVLGLAGMVGSGRSDVVKALMGLLNKDEGELLFEGRPIENVSMREAISNGFYYIPSDRKKEGIIAPMTIKENTTIANLKAYMKRGLINRRNERDAADGENKKLKTKTSSLEEQIRNLSGGNQQKVLLARALLTNPRVFCIVEPTRGIDVGAKHEIYKILRELCEAGSSVIMVSSELPEVIGMSDRILVMNQGRTAGVVDQADGKTTEEHVLSLAVGHEYSLHGKENA